MTEAKKFDATEIVSSELDKLASRHGNKYARSVSAAFCTIQLMQLITVLYMSAKGEKTDEIGMTADEALQRAPVFMSQILGMVAHKIDGELRDKIAEDAQRIYDTAVAIATKDDHPIQ